MNLKKFILGLLYQELGFLGGILIICFAAVNPVGYNSMDGILATMLATNLITPFVICVIMFFVGLVMCYKSHIRKE